MNKKKKRTIDGRTLDYTYSDAGFYIERDGVIYEDAYDPEDSGRTYTETDIVIPPDPPDVYESGVRP